MQREGEEAAREPQLLPADLPPSKKIHRFLPAEGQQEKASGDSRVRLSQAPDKEDSALLTRRGAQKEGMEGAGVFEKAKCSPSRRRGRAEELVELDEAPLRRHHAKKFRRFPQLRHGSPRDVEPRELREKPRRPENPERIFQKNPGSRRREPPRCEVRERAGSARERALGKREREGVHGEVAPEEVLSGVAPFFPDVDLVRAKGHLEDALRRGADRDDARAGPRRQRRRELSGSPGRGHEIEISASSSEERVAHRSSDGPDPVLRPREGRRRRRVGAPEKGAETAPDRGIALQREASSRPCAGGQATLFTFDPSASGYAVSSTLMASASRRATESPNSPPLRVDPTSSNR